MHVVSHIGIALSLGDIPSEWLYYWLKSLDFKKLTHPTTLPSLQLSKVHEINTSLPLLPEQRRIVTKLEELFTKLDAGVSALKKTQAQLKRYRQSVLKAACEVKHVPTEAELAKAEGHAYEPAVPDMSGLQEMPEGWSYTFIEPLLSMERTGIKTGPFGSLLKKHEHRIEGIPVLGIENIEAMKFIAGSKIQITKEKSNQLSGYDALPNDVLISRSGTVGEVCVRLFLIRCQNYAKEVHGIFLIKRFFSL